MKIPPKEKLALTIDLSKWPIAGGWIKGRYEVKVGVLLEIDNRVQLSVFSDPPLTFVVQ